MYEITVPCIFRALPSRDYTQLPEDEWRGKKQADSRGYLRYGKQSLCFENTESES